MNSTSIEVGQAGGSLAIESYEPLYDIELAIEAELDRRTVSVRELLRMEEGSLLTLTRPAGENIDVYVGGILLGSAEILATDDGLAVRIADLRDQSSALQG